MPKLASLKTEKRLLDRQAADRIRSHILGGVLPAGSRLLETKLSAELEVSRGTVRAALALLAREGLVQQVAFTRWQVSNTSPRDAWELYTLRAALEGLAARIAAEHVTPADAKRLRATVAALTRAIKDGRLDDAIDVDFRLHREIVEVAQHTRLAEQHGYIMQQVRFHMINSGFLPTDYSALVSEHVALIDAVIARDPDKAETLVKTHNESEVKLLAAHLDASAPATA